MVQVAICGGFEVHVGQRVVGSYPSKANKPEWLHQGIMDIIDYSCRGKSSLELVYY